MGLNFGKKKGAGIAPPGAPVQGPPPLPIEQVRTMKQQGMEDNQIIQTLQRDGFNSSQIFDAMNQAELKNGSAQPIPDMPAQDPQSFVQAQEQFNEYPVPSGFEQPAAPSYDGDRIEEVVESIIEEKWDALMKSVNKILEWKEKTDNKFIVMEQRVNDLKQSFDQLNRLILGKVDAYDKNIKDVGADIKAMEKVFKEILPTFTDSVSELSRITQGMKKS